MRWYFIKRLLQIAPTLVVVSLLVFIAMWNLPGNPEFDTPFDQLMLEVMPEERTFWDSVVGKYLQWFGRMLRGDWGKSMMNSRPVFDDIMRHLPISLELIAASLVIALLIAIPLGILAAVWRQTWVDYTAMTVAMIGVSIPDFLAGVLLLLLFTMSWEWLPSSGWTPLSEGVWAHVRHLVMPACALGVTQAAFLARLLRGAMLDVIHLDYMTQARVKGASEWRVIGKHALKNALIPVVTLLGIQLGFLISGTVVVETLFAVPGLGSYGMQALVERDYPKVQAFIVVVSLVFACTNVFVDWLYSVLDPRIDYTSDRNR